MPVLRESLSQAIASRIIVSDLPIAFCQGAIGACGLVHVAILREEIQCSLGKVARQQLGRHLFHIEVLKCGEIVLYQKIPAIGILDVFADGLQGIRLPVRIRIAAARHHVETDEIVEFSLTDFIGSALRDGSSRTIVIKIVEILGRILFQFIGIKHGKRLLHGPFLLHIIEIGGSHDVELALGIDGTVVFT